MKKIIAIFAIAACFVLGTELKAQAALSWPQGIASPFTFAATSGTVTFNIAGNKMNYISAIPTLTAATTISVNATANTKPGAIFVLTVKNTGTEVMTFAGAIQTTTLAGVAGKTWSQGFIYTGTKFYPMGTRQQVD